MFLRLAYGFVCAYAPAVLAMVALPMAGEAGFGAEGFSALALYLVVGAPLVWLRLDRALARRAPARRARLVHAFPARSRRVADPIAEIRAWAQTPAPDPSRRTETGPKSDTPSRARDAAPATRQTPRGRRGLWRRAEGPSLLGALGLFLLAWTLLSAATATLFSALALSASGLAWLSLYADAQTLRRRGRQEPDRAALPSLALTIGACVGASATLLWVAFAAPVA